MNSNKKPPKEKIKPNPMTASLILGPWSRPWMALLSRSIRTLDFIFEKGRSETMNAASKKDSMTEMKSKDDYPSETNVKTSTERTEL